MLPVDYDQVTALAKLVYERVKSVFGITTFSSVLFHIRTIPSRWYASYFVRLQHRSKSVTIRCVFRHLAAAIDEVFANPACLLVQIPKHSYQGFIVERSKTITNEFGRFTKLLYGNDGWKGMLVANDFTR